MTSHALRLHPRIMAKGNQMQWQPDRHKQGSKITHDDDVLLPEPYAGSEISTDDDMCKSNDSCSASLADGCDEWQVDVDYMSTDACLAKNFVEEQSLGPDMVQTTKQFKLNKHIGTPTDVRDSKYTPMVHSKANKYLCIAPPFLMWSPNDEPAAGKCLKCGQLQCYASLSTCSHVWGK